MITFSNIGKMGRLGNQMFQYAALYGTAFLRGYSFAIPRNTDLERAFTLPSKKYLTEDVEQTLYNEPSFEFHPAIWLINDNTDVSGYFQAPFYWQHCEQHIRNEFQFHENVSKLATEYLQNHDLQDKLLVSVHVRRSDYLEKSDYHKPLNSDYYSRAASEIQKHFPNHAFEFVIFSDDPEWCKSKFSGAHIVENNIDVVDLCLMSQCHVHIIANSSFSWWGAFLSGSQAIVAPREWFGPSGPKSWQSIYKTNWMVI